MKAGSALVLGGSRGIGAAIVERLALEGLDVAFTFASSKDAAAVVKAHVEAQGRQALAIQADSQDAQAVSDAVARTCGEFGKIDVLVCNAGILIPGRIEDYSLEDFDRMTDVNVRSVFVAIQAAAKVMMDGGRIVVIGSIVGGRTGFPGVSVYGMTKAAVAGLVRGAAIDLAPRAITVNTVQPGPTITDMNPSDGPMAEVIRNSVPLGRMSEPQEIASLVSYLASREASFITGSTLTVDGGVSA